MTLGALLLVIVSAFIHATWNMISKRSRGGIEYVLIVGGFAALVWAPVGLWVLLAGNAVDPGTSLAVALPCVLVSTVFHGAYFTCLQKGYSIGDMSLVYPLARGTGPLLSTALAMLLYGERPSVTALAGAALIGSGAFLLARSSSTHAKNQHEDSSQDASEPTPSSGIHTAVGWGLLTGLFIAGYTIWDKFVLSGVGVNPLFLEWGTTVGRVLLLGPALLLPVRRRQVVIQAYPGLWKTALLVAILSPLSYMMALTALKISPVSYVAPLREISILIGTLFGSRLLGEGDPQSKRLRTIAASAMALGVAALALG
ncbi:MAG: EamA family transporter [Firmicutes bacterium]|nr:EamA family transporter [Bacillota bacterium]